MPVLKRIGISASVLLNAGLLIALVGTQHSSWSKEGAQPSASTRERRPATRGNQTYHSMLVSRGLSDEEAKTILVARLETEARRKAAQPPEPYWQPHDPSRADPTLRLAAELDRARASLRSVYGSAAERDPVFSQLFRPLDPTFSFLSSSQQIEVQTLKLVLPAAL